MIPIIIVTVLTSVIISIAVCIILIKRGRRIQEEKAREDKIIKTIKSNMRYYLEYLFSVKDEEANINLHMLGITKVEVRNNKAIDITVTLHKPGLLIGVSGKTVNALACHLKEIHKKPVNIKIIEADVWK